MPRADFSIARTVVVRGVGLCALIAFASLLVQIRGLVGEHGILPATLRFERADGFFDFPGLQWMFGASDTALLGFCSAGMIASLLVVANVLPGPMLVVAYALYLSLCRLGQVFLGYQWDMLLCESLILAALLSSWTLRPRLMAPPRVPLIAVTALAARLEIGSGLSKLLSGDETWRSLTALTYHYETQPLPTPLGWLAAHFPPWIQIPSCFAMFAIQLVCPVLLFVPVRRIRHGAVVALTALQLAIAATGNYTFFNLLTVVLSLSAVDDDAFRWMRRRAGFKGARAASSSPAPAAASSAPDSSSRAPDASSSAPAALDGAGGFVPSTSAATRVATALSLLASTVVALLIPLGVIAEIDRLRRAPMPEPIVDVMEALQPFEVVGGYGLFANMTTVRDEIEIEGTLDGEQWLPYRFRDKPGDVDDIPGFVAPHQPRLDWQMWFASLGTARRNPWLIRFTEQLRDADPGALALLDGDPFDGKKPVAIRLMRWRYHVAPLGSGHAWTRELIGPYR